MTNAVGLDERGFSSRRERSDSRVVEWLVPLFSYVALAIVAYWPTLPLGSDRLTYPGGDVAEQIWYLAWVPHALAHGLNPFFSSAVNHPYGANIASNTSMPLLGLLASPFTFTFGPVAAYNLFVRIAFVVSAYSMFFVMRRFVRSWLIAELAGLVYGFSPYMIGQGYDHLYLIFVPIPPLIFWYLYELMFCNRFSVRRCGVVLGLLGAAQYFISAEILVDVALLIVIGVVLIALREPRAVKERSQRVLRAFLWAIVPFGVLVGYPAWYAVFGPQHFVTSPEPAEIAAFRSDLLGLIVPTSNERFGPTFLINLGDRFAGGDVVENGVYVGVPMVVGLTVITWYTRRRARVLFAAVMAVCAYILSLGSPLDIDNRSTGIPLPFSLLVHVPLFQDESAVRYSLFVTFFVALLLAFGLEEVSHRWIEQGWFRSCVVRMAPVGLVAAMLVPLVPRIPYTTYPASVPSFFTDGAVRSIPSGSVVLTYPAPTWPFTEPAIWQSVSEMRFTIFPGSVAAPEDLTDVGEGTPPLLLPKVVGEILAEAAYGVPATAIYGADADPGPLPSNDGVTAALIREFCLWYGVDVVIADPTIGVDPDLAISYLTRALGSPTSRTGGVEVWYDVQKDLAQRSR